MLLPDLVYDLLLSWDELIHNHGVLAIRKYLFMLVKVSGRHICCLWELTYRVDSLRGYILATLKQVKWRSDHQSSVWFQSCWHQVSLCTLIPCCHFHETCDASGWLHARFLLWRKVFHIHRWLNWDFSYEVLSWLAFLRHRIVKFNELLRLFFRPRFNLVNLVKSPLVQIRCLINHVCDALAHFLSALKLYKYIFSHSWLKQVNIDCALDQITSHVPLPIQ